MVLTNKISHLVNFDALTVKATKQTSIEHEQKKEKKLKFLIRSVWVMGFVYGIWVTADHKTVSHKQFEL